MVGRKHGCGGAERLLIPQKRVSCRNGRFRHSESEMHVPKIDDAEDCSRLRPGGGHKDVVIVGVAVDHAAPKIPEINYRSRVKELCSEGPPLPITHQREVITGPGRTGEIPFQLALCSRVREIEQRSVDLGKETTKARKKFGAARFNFSERRAGNKGQKPQQPLIASFQFLTSEQSPVRVGEHTGQRKVRQSFGKVRERAALQIHERLLAGRMHDFEDKHARI